MNCSNVDYSILSLAFQGVLDRFVPSQQANMQTPAASSTSRAESTLKKLKSKAGFPSQNFEINEKSLLKQPHNFNHRYIVACCRDPDKGSDFDLKHSGNIAALKTDKEVLRYLAKHKFGGFLLSEEEKVISHIFYQKHGPVLHAFSVYVDKSKRGYGLGPRTLLSFLEDCRQKSKIRGVRLGRGTEPFVKKFITRIMPVRSSYGISNIFSGGWIEFKHNTSVS